MHVRARRPLLWFALVLGVTWAAAFAQPTYDIGLDQTRTGTIATLDTTHVYLLDVPAGLDGLTIEVDGGDRDADLAVYYGDEELFRDITSGTRPTYVAVAPRPGRYRIEVLNLLFQELPYTLRVSRGASGPASAPTRPTVPTAPAAGSIELGGTRTGVIPTEEMYREYLLEVPAGLAGFTVRLTAGGADADMAVYLGDEELYNDISTDPNPVFAVTAPRAGTYRIVVKNLLSQPLDYVLSVSVDGAAPRPTPPTATPVGPLPPAGQGWVQTFASGGTEGWTGENASLSNPGTGGPDGRGYLYAFTPGEGAVGYFVAPARVLGNWSAFTALRLALQIGPRYDGDTFGPFESGGVGDVFLANGTMTAAYVFPSMPTRAWATFDVPLADAAAWRLGGGARSLAEVLANVTSFKVRAEYVVGDADAGLASVETLVGAAPYGPAIALECGTQAGGDTLGALEVGTSVAVTCPAGCRDDAAVWGSDVYTDDSSICRAAVHAGVIDAERGGTFVLTIREGQAAYEASTRNGVTTRPWGGWGRSFSVSPAGAATGPTAVPAAGSESVAVTSDQAATLTTAQGVVVSIPAGAVPVTEAGGVGTMVFSAEPAGLTPAPPAGTTAVGPVVQLGPAGLTFEQPVSLTFPIPAGVDPATVVGLTTFDPADGTWVVVPGVVDPAARTVTVWTDHFSPWAVAVRPAGRPVDGGVVRIANAMARGGSTVYPCDGADPNCRAGLPTSHGYGVCMVSWTLDDPNQRFWGVRDGLSRVATALDGQTIDWWLPDGTYVFEPFFHMSQINQSPLYVPRHQMYVQPAITVTLRGGQVVAFGDDYPRGYEEGWTHCHGGTGAGSTRGPITSVGTGDVQVTLTWQAEVDLDLYVTDPNGDTVYFANDRVPSGGELDRDNMCGDFEWGRPENVYWPAGGAPAGTYTVKVDYWSSCGDASPSVAWTVRTIVGGQVQTFTGTIGSDDEVEVTTFTVR